MSERNWTNQEVYDLLCKIDRGYEPDEVERTMLETREDLRLWNKKLYSVPKSIGMLRALKRLNLCDNQISELPVSIGKLFKLTELDLSTTQIKKLPACIGDLKELQTLNLRFTPIMTLPESIGELTRLKTLNLGYTKIKALPTSIGQLEILHNLDLCDTDITDLPVSIGQLTSLQRLNLGGTHITVLPDAIGKISGLQYLNLTCTQISVLPEFIGQFTNLKKLSLSHTRIAVLPEWIGKLNALEHLNLAELTLVKIPRSLALMGLPFVDMYFFPSDILGVNLRSVSLIEQNISIFLEHPELIPSLYEEQERAPECRVLFLGDGDSGKTYTIRRIQNGGKKETKEHPYPTKETPGVEIADWHVDRDADSFDVHFWDFGGQELLHSMHRCFLTDQTCYVVTVKSRETKGTQRARYWLRNVTAFAPHSPVLLYVNCWDNDDGKRSIDVSRLRKDYPNIKDVVYVSAKEAEDGLFDEKLMRPLIDMAVSSDALKRTVNSRWLAVREAIAKENDAKKGKTRHYLTKEQYHAICQEAGVEDESAPALLSYFNALGVCFSYHRDAENNELKNYKLLNPVWLTNAVYAIIEEGMSQAQEGRIKLEAIRDMLGNRGPNTVRGRDYRRTVPELIYTATECRYILDVAEAHNLCYKADEKTMFFPALCTNNTPAEALGDQESFPNKAEYRFRYEYLPDSVLHRLMIRCLKKGFAIRSCWLRGMIMDCLDTHRAIVRMDDDETLIVEIWYKEGRAAFEIFPLLRVEILAVSNGLNLKAKELIADGTDSFPMVQLVSEYRKGRDEFSGNDTGDEYSVKELLGRFFDTETVDCLEIADGRLRIKPYEYHAHSQKDPALRRAIWEAYGRKCQYCNLPLGYEEMQIDHILAKNHLPSRDNRTDLYLAELSQRCFDLKNPDYIENYFPSCGHCNRGKSNATRDAVTLREYHAVAREHLDKVLRLMWEYERKWNQKPKDEENLK